MIKSNRQKMVEDIVESLSDKYCGSCEDWEPDWDCDDCPVSKAIRGAGEND